MKAGKIRKPGRGWLFLLVFLYLAHNDFWNWGDPRLFFGLPILLVYHVVYCLAVALVFAELSKYLFDDDEPGETPE